MNDFPRIFKIEKVVDEAENKKTFFFKCDFKYKAGQFFMLWIPGMDEKPFALSYKDKGISGFTVEKVGPFTTRLFELEPGERVGIRGPYGNGFTVKENSCLVGGGIGMASLATLVEASKNCTLIVGAKTKERLLYYDRFKNLKGRTIYYKPFKEPIPGKYKKYFSTVLLEELLQKNKFSIVQTCGPEVMMRKVFELCEKYNVECEASLERYMACAFGVCGKCMAGDRVVCYDGPVFNSEKLRKIQDFGKIARLRTGKKVTLQEYHKR